MRASACVVVLKFYGCVSGLDSHQLLVSQEENVISKKIYLQNELLQLTENRIIFALFRNRTFCLLHLFEIVCIQIAVEES